jgi:type I restriction enzyme S subunit
MKDVGRWFGGGTPSKANPHFWTGGTIPWVSPKDMKRDKIGDAQDHITEDAVAQSATNLVEADSVLIVVRSGILQHTLPVAIAQREVALNQDLKAVKTLCTIGSDYLALALKAYEREILHTCTKTGTTVQSLEMPVFLRFTVPVAPLPEQRRIVAEIEKQFTRLEAGVAALKRVQANLKRYRAAVLKAACEGRLVPTEAEIARKEGRAYESGTALLARILSERRKNWQGRGKYKEPAAPATDSLGALPEGWTWARLEQLGYAFGGLTKNPKRANLPLQLPYLRVANVYANQLRLQKIEYIGVDHSELEKLLIHRGDLLIVEGNGSKDQIGRLAIWDGSIDLCVHQNHLIKVRPLESQMSKWILYWLQSPNGRSFVEHVASSTSGLYTLSVNKVGDLPVPLAPVAEQARIVAEVERRLSVIEGMEAAVAANTKRAAGLRQAILQKAFSGELFA